MQGLDAQSLKSVSNEIMQAVDAAENLEALDAIRVNALGKKGRISLLMRELGVWMRMPAKRPDRH